MLGFACDLCHRRKERCHFDADEKCCRRCKLLQAECSFSRRPRRRGRPPLATRTLPAATCEFISFEIHQGYPQPPGSSSSERESSESDTVSSEPDSRPSSLGLPNASKSHETTATGSASAATKATAPLPSPFMWITDLFNSEGLWPAVNQHAETASRQQRMYAVLSDEQLFYDSHRHFMIGRSFANRFREAFSHLLPHSSGLLLHAAPIILSVWDATQNNELGKLDLRDGSSCLQMLHAPALDRLEDAAAIVLLGQALFVYHIAALGTSAHTIIRRALGLAQGWYPSLLTQPTFDSIVLAPILLDTVESLLRRTVPVIKIPLENCCTVDRTFGLCSSLLPIHYDICKVSHAAKKRAAEAIDPEALSDLREQVRKWEPVIPIRLFRQYSRLEVFVMMLQARIYRTATLLILHRLQYPLGTEDEAALVMAMTIAAEIESVLQWCPGQLTGLAIGLPTLVCRIEMDDLDERAGGFLPTHPSYVKKLADLIKRARSAHQTGFRGLWFDLVDEHLDIPITP